MIDNRLIKLVERLHSDIKDLYFALDIGIESDDVLNSLGAILKYADETLDEI